jgi:glyoxylase-like metal-dependent hydrolase (beta-lactamase superfamily II)
MILSYDGIYGFKKLDEYVGKYPIIIYAWSDPPTNKHYWVIKGTTKNRWGKSYILLDPGYGNIEWEFSEEGLKRIWAGGQFKMIVAEGWS